ncbi:hypothetical protein D3C78_1579080 [compost metagenome]
MRQGNATARLLHTNRHSGNRRRHALLNRFGNPFDFCRRLAGLFCQSTHFVGDHGKTAPVFPRVRGLNRSIDCQQIGLRSNFTD